MSKTSRYDLGTFFNSQNSMIDYTSVELRKEMLLEFDNFRQPNTVENLQGIATQVHNLLFLEAGTYPDCPDMGIGIQNYQFELMNDETLSKIKEKIRDQITQYIPTIYINDIIIQKFNNENLNKTIGIGFEVTAKNTSGQFFLLLQELPDSREIISQIVY